MAEARYNFRGILNDFFKSFSQMLLSNVYTRAGEFTDNTLDKLDSKINKIERRVFGKIYFVIFLAIGAIFLVLALYYLFVSIGMSNSLAALIVGAALIITGFIIKMSSERRQNGE